MLLLPDKHKDLQGFITSGTWGIKIKSKEEIVGVSIQSCVQAPLGCTYGIRNADF